MAIKCGRVEREKEGKKAQEILKRLSFKKSKKWIKLRDECTELYLSFTPVGYV